MREITVKVFPFSELSDEAKENARKWARSVQENDDWYAEDEGILYDKNLTGYEIFKNVIPKYWNVGYGHRHIQFELEFKENGESELAKWLGISSSLQKKISIGFENPTTTENTKIVFYDVNGNKINLDYDYTKDTDDSCANFWLVEKEDLPTKSQYESLYRFAEKWDDLMHLSCGHLEKNYEWQFSDEGIDDFIINNNYEFDEEGNIV